MIKSAVVTANTPCVDSNSTKEVDFFDGDKFANKENTKMVKLSKVLDNKQNELEYTKPLYK